MHTETEKFLRQGLELLDIHASAETANAFLTYMRELRKWNRTYNLTGLRTDEDIIVKHFLDSLLYLKAMPEGFRAGDPGRVVKIADIGSGAGFPGVPIKIIRPEFQIALIEPSLKKSVFLRHIISELRLTGVEVIKKRVEEIRDASFDIVLTRALFDIRHLVEKASLILKKGGVFIISKGPGIEKELEGLSGVGLDVLKLNLPLTSIVRSIAVIRKD